MTLAIEPVTAEPPALEAYPVLHQQWAELAYFHWPYEPADVQRLLPPGVMVDTFDDAAWIGLIPFEMRNVQLGPTPSVPWVGNFVEINVRTYVRDRRGRRAVWFFSLDVPRALIVAVARSVFALPYCWARASHSSDGDRHHYSTTRRWPRRASATAEMGFRVGDRLEDADVGDLEHFLTARWALLTRRRGSLLFGRVRHPRWPLHRAEDVTVSQTLVEAAGLPAPSGEPHALCSPGVDVDVAWFETPTTEEQR